MLGGDHPGCVVHRSDVVDLDVGRGRVDQVPTTVVAGERAHLVDDNRVTTESRSLTSAHRGVDVLVPQQHSSDVGWHPVHDRLGGEDTSEDHVCVGDEKSVYREDLTDDVIATMAEHLPHKNSPGSLLTLYRLDEAYSAPADDDTAFGGSRKPHYTVFLVGRCPTPELLATERHWVRSLHQALTRNANIEPA
jgi:hypothetical protein